MLRLLVLGAYWFNGKLGDSQFTLFIQANLAIGYTAKVSLYYEDNGRANSQPAGLDTFGKFRKLIRSNTVLSVGITIHTVVLLDGVLEQPRGQMSPGVHGNNLLGVSPLRERANVRGRLGVGEVGTVYALLVMIFGLGSKDIPVIGVQFVAGNGEGIVDRVRTTANNLFSIVSLGMNGD